MMDYHEDKTPGDFRRIADGNAPRYLLNVECEFLLQLRRAQRANGKSMRTTRYTDIKSSNED